MKRTLIFTSLLFTLISLQAQAAHFKCDLNLNVIEDTSSSEYKQLSFDLDLNTASKNVMTGTLTSMTCYNTLIDPFTSESVEFKKMYIGNQILGTLRTLNLSIGKHHYNLDLSFSQLAADSVDHGVITLAASGKMIPLDNEYYIHQNVVGECYLSEEKVFLPKSITLPDMDCQH